MCLYKPTAGFCTEIVLFGSFWDLRVRLTQTRIACTQCAPGYFNGNNGCESCSDSWLD